MDVVAGSSSRSTRRDLSRWHRVRPLGFSGGVPGLKPGKTTITLALMDHRRCSTLPTPPRQLLPSRATLIMMPPNLWQQWQAASSECAHEHDMTLIPSYFMTFPDVSYGTSWHFLRDLLRFWRFWSPRGRDQEVHAVRRSPRSRRRRRRTAAALLAGRPSDLGRGGRAVSHLPCPDVLRQSLYKVDQSSSKADAAPKKARI